ncbi:unnamed protein product [[Candida] boidinii]|nr:unnamed protein product [[Candida] boidinii]
MLHCVYCKSLNHDIEKCPLVPRCLQCPRDQHNHPQEHNYLSCPYNDIEEKMNAIQNLSSITIQNALKTKQALKQIPQAPILHPSFPKESLTAEQYNQFITSAQKTISKQKAIAEAIKNTKPSQETKENVTLKEWMVAKTTRRRGPSQNYNSQNTSSNTKTYNKNTNSFAILNNETVEEPQTTYEGSSKDKITTEQAQSVECRSGQWVESVT